MKTQLIHTLSVADMLEAITDYFSNNISMSAKVRHITLTNNTTGDSIQLAYGTGNGTVEYQDFSLVIGEDK